LNRNFGTFDSGAEWNFLKVTSLIIFLLNRIEFSPRDDNSAESKENDQFLEQLWSVQVFQPVGGGEGIEGKSGYLEEIKEREMNKKGQRLATTTTTMETTLGPEGDSSPFSLCLPVWECSHRL
jgi:hypothetical protein